MSATLPVHLRVGLQVGEAADKLLRFFSKRVMIGLTALSSCGALISMLLYSAMPRAQMRTAVLELNTISNCIELYRQQNQHLPAHLEELVPDYLMQLSLDPWGHRFSYVIENGSARVISDGPDGVLGTGDDVVSLSPSPLGGRGQGLGVGSAAASCGAGIKENEAPLSKVQLERK